MLPLLPAGHPRWDSCRFAQGDTTANYRGYGARWAIVNGRLFLTGFGGYADDGAGFGRRMRTEGPRRTIGMIDVHEVDRPVPATWITRDLVCPSGEAAGARWEDFVPESFLLFRVVRSTVVAQMSAPNVHRTRDEHFRGEKLLLDGHLASGGASPPEVAPTSLDDLGGALRKLGSGDSRRRLATMLWHTVDADLDVLWDCPVSVDGYGAWVNRGSGKGSGRAFCS